MKPLVKTLHSPRGGAILAGLLALLVLLPGWFWLVNWYQANLIQQARAKVTVEAAARANALTSAVNQRIALLQGLYAFTRTEWPDTQFDQPFEIYSSGVYFNSTGVRTLMIAPEGIARYIFPVADSPQLSGYDILNDPDPATRDAVQRAIHTRAIALSPPGELRQGGFGVTAWEAVYRGKNLWGLVSIAVDLNTIVSDAQLNDPAGGLSIALRDQTGQNFYGPGAVWQQSPVIQKIEMPDGSWELGSIPQNGWDATVHLPMNVFRLGGLAIVGLMAGMITLAVNQQARLAQAVAMRTRQIAEAQQKLEQRVQARTRELSSLQNVSQQISTTLALEPLLAQILAEIKNALDYSAAAIFRLDETGQVTLANQAGIPLPAPLLDKALARQVLETLQPVIAERLNAGGKTREAMAWMGVPLVVKDHALGLMIFAHQDARAYGEEETNLALAFAQQVAVALENARLYEQAGQLAVLEERQRLARELHDSVSQVLYSIGLGAKAARAALAHDPARLNEALDYVDHLAEAGQVEMRALIFELRPESLRNDGLVAALEKQAAVLRTRHQIAVQAQLCPEPAVSMVVKEALYRVSQEAIHNIIKHANATQVTLAMECSKNEICLEVSDNGCGFDPLAGYPGHLGLQSMRERATRCKGHLTIESAPDRGTRIRLVIPTQTENPGIP